MAKHGTHFIKFFTSLLRFQAGSEAGTSAFLTGGSDGVLASMAGVTDSPKRATGLTTTPRFLSKRARR